MSYFITDAFTAHAQAFLNGVTDQDRLVAPEYFIVEGTNVVWRHVVFNAMPRTTANAILHDLLHLPIDRIPVDGLLTSALDIGIKHHLAIYDAVHIAMALVSRFPLITLDQKQARAAAAEGVTLKPLTDFIP